MMNGYTLYTLLEKGLIHLETKKHEVNQINVFPIADQDTGSNMVYTLKMALSTSVANENYSKTIFHIAQQATLYARGNSGIILAQFLQGMTYIPHCEKIPDDLWIHNIQKSADRLYEVVDTPVDKTILSVIKDWAYSFKQDSKLSLMKQCLASIRYLNISLVQTKKQMINLRRQEVYDAGALGFYYLIEGICYHMDEHHVRLKKIDCLQTIKNHHAIDDYRYCCQFLVENDKTLIKKLKDCPCGSIAYTCNDQYMNLHVHTNDPCLISECIDEIVRIKDVKIDDMKQKGQKTKGKIALLTDTIADINIDHMNDVYWLPMTLCVNDSVYLDKYTLKNKEFLAKQKFNHDKITTSQPNQAQIHYLLDHLLAKYEKIIIICVSSQLSGCCSGIRQYLKNNPEYALKVFLIDSQLNSVAQGLLVLKTYQKIQHTQDMQEILMYIQSLKQRIKTYVYVDNFHVVKKGGRIPSLMVKTADKFHLKGILTLSRGKPVAFGFGAKQEEIENKILQKIQHETIEDYAIAYGINDHQSYTHKIEKLLNLSPLYEVPTSCVTLLNVGENAYAIGYIVKEKKHG